MYFRGISADPLQLCSRTVEQLQNSEIKPKVTFPAMDSNVDIIFSYRWELFNLEYWPVYPVVHGWKFNVNKREMRNKEIILFGSKLNTLLGYISIVRGLDFCVVSILYR
jgi:hypothetical protein